MIHKTVKKTEVEIIAPQTTPIVRQNTSVMVRQPRRARQIRTLFEGNKQRLLWDGLGENVSSANNAYEVCKMAGLDFTVVKENVYTEDGMKIPNMVVTRRYDNLSDGTQIPSTVYGAVTPRYQPVQNYEGFEFIDTLFHHDGFEVETAGHFDDGKIVWVEARLPERTMTGEKINPYIVFTNRHDGKGSVRIFLTPVRIICLNTLNLAIKGAKDRTFAVRHTATANEKLVAAKETIQHYYDYLDALAIDIERQKRMCLGKEKVENMIETLLSFKESDTQRVKDRVLINREELKRVYYNAPDLDGYEHSAFRLVNAVSDWATHRVPARQTANYANNLFQNTLEGNEYIDKIYDIVNAMESTANKTIAIA